MKCVTQSSTINNTIIKFHQSVDCCFRLCSKWLLKPSDALMLYSWSETLSLQYKSVGFKTFIWDSVQGFRANFFIFFISWLCPYSVRLWKLKPHRLYGNVWKHHYTFLQRHREKPNTFQGEQEKKKRPGPGETHEYNRPSFQPSLVPNLTPRIDMREKLWFCRSVMSFC